MEEERQLLVRTRILRAGLSALRDVGANVSVEEIAACAGASRRTVFRYFPTRDDLIAAALASTFDD
jgi:AcrR family transcriptional regulator